MFSKNGPEAVPTQHKTSRCAISLQRATKEDNCFHEIRAEGALQGPSSLMYLSGLNHYSQLSDFWEILIRITVTVTVTGIIFPRINYITVMSPLQL